LNGLDSNGFSGHTIYCSKITKELIKQIPKYNKNLSSIKVLEINKRHELTMMNGDTIIITLIPARHCPGAVMFLIENDFKSILITGDIRAELDWVESLPRNKFLSPYISGLKQLDNIYLDTTYGYRNEPYIELKPNYYGLKNLVDLINLYPKDVFNNNGDDDDDDYEIQFHFADSILGFEEIWLHLTSIFNAKLHTSSDIYKRLKMLDNSSNGFEYQNQISDILTMNNNAKFHCCGDIKKNSESCNNKVGPHNEVKLNKKKTFKVRIKHRIDITIDELMNKTFPLSFEKNKNFVTFVDELSNGHKIYLLENIPYLLPKNGTHLLRNELLFVNSRHSSYKECRHFIEKFHVKQVYPLTESAKSWERGFQMKRHFGDLCTNDFSLYDELSTKIYGTPPSNLSSSSSLPKSIDKFDEDVYLKSWNENLINETTISIDEFDFKGQQTVKNQAFRTIANDLSNEEKIEMNERLKLVKMSNLINGRHQYILEGKIKTQGYGILNKYKNHNYVQDSCDSDSYSQENDSMDRAIYQMNQQIENNTNSELNNDTTTTATTTKILTSPFNSVSQHQEQNIIESIDSVIEQNNPIIISSLASPTKLQLLQPHDQNNISSNTKNDDITVLQKKLLASPISSIKSYTNDISEINNDTIKQITNAIRKDENYGFFQFELKSCTKKQCTGRKKFT